MTACIRSDWGTWTQCKCDPCRTRSNRLAKLARNGKLIRVPSEQAWELINKWVAQGYEPTWIASACGVPDRLIAHALQDRRAKGYPQRFGPKRAAQIVTANIDTATRGRRNATGTRRRLQALAVNGWDTGTLADLTGISFVTLAAIRRGATSSVGAPHWHTIRDAYNSLGDTRGPSKEATRRATNANWCPPAQWDDPDADPQPVTVSRGPGNHRTTLEDFDDLISLGESEEIAAQRLGVRLQSIHAARTRQEREVA